MKKKMLVLSGLFFNASGNQSMEQSVAGYMKDYDVTLVTAANMNGTVYKTIEAVRERYPELKIYAVGGTAILSILVRLKKGINDFLGRGKVVDSQQVSIPADTSGGIVNSPAGLGTRIFFCIREFILFFLCLFFSIFKKFDAVCAYEINATRPIVWARRFFRGAPVLFGKFQGTVLGSVRHALEREDVKRLYWMDLRGMEAVCKLDACIMTNDGTFGDAVLEKFGVSKRRILFIPNGVALTRNGVKRVQDKQGIKIISVSRLTSWKRVHVVIMAVKILVEKYKRLDFSYDIYGIGSASEEKFIADFIKEMNLQDYVSYRGRLAHVDVVEAFMAADVLVSIYAHSNVCNPVFEASYLSVPVLTIDSEELKSIAGGASDSYFFVQDSDEDAVLAERVAEQLNGFNEVTLAAAVDCLRKNADSFNSWSERSVREIEFIQSLAR